MSRELAGLDVIIVSDTDWSGMMLQKQQWAIRFAAAGHRVTYVNKTPQRPVRWSDFKRIGGALSGRGLSPGHIAAVRTAPPGVEPTNLRLLPPTVPFAAWNRYIAASFAKRMKARHDRYLFLTYTPTPGVLHLMRALQPELSAYVCVHNYAGIPGIPSAVLRSERELAAEVSEVFCDSRFLAETWSAHLGRSVRRLLPACDPERFRQAWRGDELTRARTVGFFGSSFAELDLEAYRAVSDAGFGLEFIGPHDAAVGAALDGKVKWHPAVPNDQLPGVLRQIDILMLVYRQSARNLGVIPAKFFECLATGKPLLISPLPDMADYGDCVNIIDGPDSVQKVLAGIESDPHAKANVRRFEIAAASSWETRFDQLQRDLATALSSSRERHE